MVQKISKILFFARDHGGLKAIIPVIKRINSMTNYQSLVISHPDTRNIIDSESIENIPLENLSQRAEDQPVFDKIIKDLSPDLLVTAKSVPLRNEEITIEQKLIHSSIKFQIKSLLILDSWGDYKARFCSEDGSLLDEYCPSVVCALDNNSFKDLVKIGMPEDKVEITGSPYFDHIIDDLHNRNIPRGKDIDPEARNILFVSQPIMEKSNFSEYGFDQVTLFKELKSGLESMGQDRPVNLLIWKHPKEYKFDWSTYHGQEQENIKCNVCEERGAAILAHIDGLFTAYSTYLYEALYFDVPVHNIVIGGSGNLDKFLYPCQLGLSEVIRTREQLIDALKKIGNSKVRAKLAKTRMDFQTRKIFFSDGNATERVISVLSKLIASSDMI